MELYLVKELPTVERASDAGSGSMLGVYVDAKVPCRSCCLQRSFAREILNYGAWRQYADSQESWWGQGEHAGVCLERCSFDLR